MRWRLRRPKNASQVQHPTDDANLSARSEAGEPSLQTQLDELRKELLELQKQSIQLQHDRIIPLR
jgi:hypothetical protein